MPEKIYAEPEGSGIHYGSPPPKKSRTKGVLIIALLVLAFLIVITIFGVTYASMSF